MAGTSREPVRSARAIKLDAKILDACATVVAEKGVDALSMVSLAAACGSTTGPLYARYDAPEDVVVHLWSSRVLPALSDFFRTFAAAVDGDDDAASNLQSFDREVPIPLLAGVEIIAVARRFPQLAELVAHDLGELVDEHLLRHSERPGAVALADCSVALGMLFLEPALAVSERSSWQQPLLALRLARTITVPAASAHVPTPAPTATPVQFPVTGDDVVDAFVSAALVVIGRVGFEYATATRIARLAGYSFSTAYTHFPNKEALVTVAVDSVIDNIISTAMGRFVRVTRDEFIDASVANARGLLDDANRPLRNLRLETVTAARHHVLISDALTRGYERLRALAHSLVTEEFGATELQQEHLGAYWAMVRANSYGISLLASATRLGHDIDWRPASAALYELFRVLVLGESAAH